MALKTGFHIKTSTFPHLIWDDKSLQAAIIDAVIDFDYETGRSLRQAFKKAVKNLEEPSLNLVYSLKTHAHAGHLSAAPFVKERCGGQIATGAIIPVLQKVFKTLFNLNDLAVDGSYKYVIQRSERDAQPAPPHLIIPSIQVNIRAGPTPLPKAMAFLI